MRYLNGTRGITMSVVHGVDVQLDNACRASEDNMEALSLALFVECFIGERVGSAAVDGGFVMHCGQARCCDALNFKVVSPGRGLLPNVKSTNLENGNFQSENRWFGDIANL